MNKKVKTGLMLVLATAIISGVANYINKWGVTAVGDPFVYTTMKNVVTALLLICLVLLFKNWESLKNISRKNWFKLILVGLIGGSIPFLLFFWGLSLTSPASASFIHKTLFIWVALLAWPFLKERFRGYQYAALIFLLLGNVILAGPKAWQWGLGESLALLATLLWASEFILSKHLLKNIHPHLVAWARLFFGSCFLLAFLGFTGKISLLATQSWLEWRWALLTGVVLFFFVWTWYQGLSRLPVTLATSVLVLASPVTTLLNGLANHNYTWQQGLGSLVLLGGAFIFTLLVLLHDHQPSLQTQPRGTNS